MKTRDDTRDIALDRARSLRGLFFANWTEPSLKLIFRGEYERASICLRTRDGIKGGDGRGFIRDKFKI